MRTLKRFPCKTCGREIGTWEGKGRIPRTIRVNGTYLEVDVETVQVGWKNCKLCAKKRR